MPTRNSYPALPRKRKREILEEEESDVEVASDGEKDLDVFDMSWELGEGGPQGVVAKCEMRGKVYKYSCVRLLG